MMWFTPSNSSLCVMYQIEPRQTANPLTHWRKCWDLLEGAPPKTPRMPIDSHPAGQCAPQSIVDTVENFFLLLSQFATHLMETQIGAGIVTLFLWAETASFKRQNCWGGGLWAAIRGRIFSTMDSQLVLRGEVWCSVHVFCSKAKAAIQRLF